MYYASSIQFYTYFLELTGVDWALLLVAWLVGDNVFASLAFLARGRTVGGLEERCTETESYVHVMSHHLLGSTNILVVITHSTILSYMASLTKTLGRVLGRPSILHSTSVTCQMVGLFSGSTSSMYSTCTCKIMVYACNVPM